MTSDRCVHRATSPVTTGRLPPVRLVPGNVGVVPVTWQAFAISCHIVAGWRPEPSRRPTLTDVAEAAGVATSTVSRAFSRPERINHRTREHVLAGGRASSATCPTRRPRRSGPGGRAPIALLVPDITNPYFSGVIKGAERAAAAAGLTLVLGDTAENPTAEAELVRRLERAVDGFVISASRLADDELRGRGRAQPDRTGQPGHGRPRLRGGRLRLRDPADRRPPRVLRPPVASSSPAVRPSPGRARGAGRGCRRPRAERGHGGPPLRSLHAHARGWPGRRRRRGGGGGHGGGLPQRHARHRRDAPAARARPPHPRGRQRGRVRRRVRRRLLPPDR